MHSVRNISYSLINTFENCSFKHPNLVAIACGGSVARLGLSILREIGVSEGIQRTTERIAPWVANAYNNGLLSNINPGHYLPFSPQGVIPAFILVPSAIKATQYLFSAKPETTPSERIHTLIRSVYAHKMCTTMILTCTAAFGDPLVRSILPSEACAELFNLGVFAGAAAFAHQTSTLYDSPNWMYLTSLTLVTITNVACNCLALHAGGGSTDTVVASFVIASTLLATTFSTKKILKLVERGIYGSSSVLNYDLTHLQNTLFRFYDILTDPEAPTIPVEVLKSNVAQFSQTINTIKKNIDSEVKSLQAIAVSPKSTDEQRQAALKGLSVLANKTHKLHSTAETIQSTLSQRLSSCREIALFEDSFQSLVIPFQGSIAAFFIHEFLAAKKYIKESKADSRSSTNRQKTSLTTKPTLRRNRVSDRSAAAHVTDRRPRKAATPLAKPKEKDQKDLQLMEEKIADLSQRIETLETTCSKLSQASAHTLINQLDDYYISEHALLIENDLLPKDKKEQAEGLHKKGQTLAEAITDRIKELQSSAKKKVAKKTEVLRKAISGIQIETDLETLEKHYSTLEIAQEDLQESLLEAKRSGIESIDSAQKADSEANKKLGEVLPRLIRMKNELNARNIKSEKFKALGRIVYPKFDLKGNLETLKDRYNAIKQAKEEFELATKEAEKFGIKKTELCAAISKAADGKLREIQAELDSRP